MQARVEEKESREEKDWKGVKEMFLNNTTFTVASFVTLCTAVVQTYKAKSRSSEDIQEKFGNIINALKDIPTIKDTLEALSVELAKKPEEGAKAAQKMLDKLIGLINEQIKANPDLVGDAEGLKQHTVNTTSDYNTLRGVALGGLAAIVGSALLVDFLQQVKQSLNPSDRKQLAVNGTISLTMITLLILRAKSCFSSEYKDAPSGYMCSKAEDPTARGFNNFLIEIGFLGAADITLRFLNSCFKSGVRATGEAISNAVSSIPTGISSGYASAKQKVSLWLNPGDEVIVRREGAQDLQVSVEEGKGEQYRALPSPSAPGNANRN